MAKKHDPEEFELLVAACHRANEQVDVALNAVTAANFALNDRIYLQEEARKRLNKYVRELAGIP